MDEINGKCVALFVIELNQSKLFVIDPIEATEATIKRILVELPGLSSLPRHNMIQEVQLNSLHKQISA